MQDKREQFVELQRELNKKVQNNSTNIMLKYINQAKEGSLTEKEKELHKDISHLLSLVSGLVSQVGFLYMFMFSEKEESTDIN